MKYSVIDFETTGLCYYGNDRVVEVGIVKIDNNGKILDEYESLINAKRDIGPTHKHKITPKMIESAPEFHEVANDILRFINGTIFVAHNAPFDKGFLIKELLRAKHDEPKIEHVCTQKLTGGNTSLEYLCKYYNVNYNPFKAHSALYDAKLTAQVFHKVKLENNLEFSNQQAIKTIITSEQSTTPFTRKDFEEHENNLQSNLEVILKIAPNECEINEENNAYIKLLDHALIDREISTIELKTLSEHLEKHPLSKKELLKQHEIYFKDQIKVYLEDDIITPSEKDDLDVLMKILLLKKGLKKYVLEVRNDQEKQSEFIKKDFTGKSVCFSGKFQSKKRWHTD